MPEVNLLQDTESPDQPPKKPRLPGQPELSDPSSAPSGLGKFFKNFLGKRPPDPTVRSTDASRMGLGKSRPDQRIINEKRSAKPTTVIPLPDDEEGGFNVNLLDEALVSRFKPRQTLLALLAWVAGAAALVGIAFGGLEFVERTITTQIEEKRNELASVQQEIRALESQQQEIVDTAAKLAAIRSLVDRHVRWTKFFTVLERYTLPQVFYGTTFTGDIQGQLTMSARTDSYESVAEQYLVFQQAVEAGDFISSFNITGASRSVTTEGESATFSVTLSVLPVVFQNRLASEVEIQPTTP